MFDRYELKVLDDPQKYLWSLGIYPGDCPYRIQQGTSIRRRTDWGNIHLTDRQIGSLMSAIEQTRGTEREAVREWIKQNRAFGGQLDTQRQGNENI